MNARQGCFRLFFTIICWALMAEAGTAAPQTGIAVPDWFRHAEPFIRTLEAGGLIVQGISGSTLEASFGGGQQAAFITTDKGVVEIIVFPGATDAEQLSITYTKWDGNRHHYRIEGPSVRTAEDQYGQPGYFTLYKNWFIQTQQGELDQLIKRILGQSGR